MSFDLILKSISRQVTLAPQEIEEFSSLLTIKKVKRKQYLVREGEICLHESYINKGCMRAFYVAPNGMEHNYYFAIEDWWISDVHSRTFREPSFCNIIALEDSELVQITQANLEKFLIKVPVLERFFRISYQQSLAVHQLKFIQMLHMTASDRYRYFRLKYPQLDQRIPQKHIATFLGLTPEFFNTVRTKVIRNI